ncbi:MAG TPA: GGDEF domain-containing protein [Terracidiphilus sp.]
MVINTPTFLLASPEPALLNRIEPVLSASGPRVEIVLTAEAALSAMAAATPPALALLDVNLPGMETGQLLAGARAAGKLRFPIVLIMDVATQEWIDRMAEGVIEDVILRGADPAYWQLRIGMAIHTHQLGQELDALREDTVKNSQFDRLTGVYNRETLLSMLLRETDRAQRLNATLSLLLFDVDDFGHWNSRLGTDACDELLFQVASRTSRLLRSYDLIGRPGKDEFLLGLPGCEQTDAVSLAQRLRAEVFCRPFRVAAESIRLSACFGIASSKGCSPGLVLREAEQALEWAKKAGPESIQCFGEKPEPEVSPVTFLSANSGDELMVW